MKLNNKEQNQALKKYNILYSSFLKTVQYYCVIGFY